MGAGQTFEIPRGWVARGFRFEVAATTAEQQELIRQHFGARRFAHNWALAQVRANLDARAVDPAVPALGWSLPALRRAWSQAKQQVAPWWRECSKENTRRLERLLAKGQARILSMTLAEHGGRLVVSVAAIVRHPPRTPAEPDARCGIDLGIGRQWAVIAHDDTIQRVAHPAPWVQTHSKRRRVARQRSRRIVGSRGHRQASAKLAALDRRAANLRANQVHLLTTTLARRYATIVVEDLGVAAMGRGMGRRAFRRGVAQAGLGKVRPTLAYKAAQQGGRLLVADRWFASSKTHYGCGGYLADLKLSQRAWACPACGAMVDRNANAALNLRDWTGPVAVAVDGERGVQRGGVAAPVPCVGDHGGQAHVLRGRVRLQKTTLVVAGADDARTKPQQHEGAEPRTGVPVSMQVTDAY
jgi:putative transposase